MGFQGINHGTSINRSVLRRNQPRLSGTAPGRHPRRRIWRGLGPRLHQCPVPAATGDTGRYIPASRGADARWSSQVLCTTGPTEPRPRPSEPVGPWGDSAPPCRTLVRHGLPARKKRTRGKRLPLGPSLARPAGMARYATLLTWPPTWKKPRPLGTQMLTDGCRSFEKSKTLRLASTGLGGPLSKTRFRTRP
jgi:hypothetical protein